MPVGIVYALKIVQIQKNDSETGLLITVVYQSEPLAGLLHVVTCPQTRKGIPY